MPIYKGRNIPWEDIFPTQPLEGGMQKGVPLDLISYGENVGKRFIGKMPHGCIENTLAMCPECHDTHVNVSSTVKCSSPPIYSLSCDKCGIAWEANLE